MDGFFEVFWALVVFLGVLSRLLGGGSTVRRGQLPRRRGPVQRIPTGGGDTAHRPGPASPPRPARPAGWPFPDLGWPFDEIFGWDDEEETEAPRTEPSRDPTLADRPVRPGVPRPRQRRRPSAEGAAAGVPGPGGEGLPSSSEGTPSAEGPALQRPVRHASPAAAAPGREDPRGKVQGPAAVSGLSPLAQAVAWSVILGPPRAHQPWRPVGWRRGV